MPALNFKLRFVSRVAAGSKPHTIRAWRRRPFKVGDKLAFFTGMRTKQCRRIRANARCRAARTIKVDTGRRRVILEGRQLTPREVKTLAEKDGFTRTDEFWDFFEKTHGRVLRGQLIEW
jgi:hypothetical protein